VVPPNFAQTLSLLEFFFVFPLPCRCGLWAGTALFWLFEGAFYFFPFFFARLRQNFVPIAFLCLFAGCSLYGALMFFPVSQHVPSLLPQSGLCPCQTCRRFDGLKGNLSHPEWVCLLLLFFSDFFRRAAPPRMFSPPRRLGLPGQLCLNPGAHSPCGTLTTSPKPPQSFPLFGAPPTSVFFPPDSFWQWSRCSLLPG